jgi:chitin disaccharide deacetylase
MAIVINADDFGLSAPVNDGILAAFRQGWISSATLMANMPALDAAIAAAQQQGCHRSLGVHLNLTQGTPLSDAIRRQPRLCSPSGEFIARPRDLFRLRSAEAQAVADELRAQVAAIRSRGIEPTHLDSHHHAHTSWAVSGVVMAIAQELGVRRVRTAHNAGRLISRKHKIYSALLNSRLNWHGLRGTAWFCSLESATAELLQAPGGIEVMVHPVMTEAGTVVDFPRSLELGGAVTTLLQGRPIVSYGDT